MPSVIEAIPITLDKPRLMKFTHGPLMEAERTLTHLWGTRVNLLTLFDPDDAGQLGMNEAIVLLWASLRHEDPALTLETVCAITPLNQSIEVVEKIVQAWLAVYGQDDDAPVPERRDARFSR